MKQGKAYQSFAKRMDWSQQTLSSKNTREDSTHGHHQMVNTEIKDGEALYSQQKQDQELTVAQIMTSFKRSRGFPGLQRLKRLPAMWETWVRSLGREDPLEKEMATHSSVLAWRIPGMGEAGGLPSGVAQSQTLLSNFHFHMFWNAKVES